MRHTTLLIALIILNACNYNALQPSPPLAPTIEIEPTSTATTPHVQFVVATSTPTPLPEHQLSSPTEETEEEEIAEADLPLAARVNGQPIYLETYEKQVVQFKQTLKAQGVDMNSEQGRTLLAQIERQVLAGLIDQLIIEQQAEHLGISISQAEVQASAQKVIARLPPTTQFEVWLEANNLTNEQFLDNLRAQLIANQLFEQITQEVPETVEKQQVFNRWLQKQREAANIERFVAW